jgi:hypothetical protein
MDTSKFLQMFTGMVLWESEDGNGNVDYKYEESLCLEALLKYPPPSAMNREIHVCEQS